MPPYYEPPDFSFRMPSFGGTSRPARQPFTPEQNQEMSKDLYGTVTGGLNYVLGSLNKPGRAVRGLLGGKPHEALAAIPFSDTLGITNPDNEVTGRNLMDQLGVTRKGDKGWGAWGAGLATDLVTDPLSYASFGARHALTGAGRALEAGGHLQGWGRKALLEGYDATETGLRAAGHTPELINHARDAGQRIASPAAESAYLGSTGQALRGGESLSGLGRFAVPFNPEAGFSFGKGRAAQAVAGHLDTTADYLKHGTKLGRFVQSHLNSNVKGATGAHTQRAMANEGTPLGNELLGQARLNQYEAWKPLDDLIRANPQDEIAILRAAGVNLEGTSPLAYLGSGAPGHYLAATKGIGDQLAKHWQDVRGTENAAGVTTANVADRFARYGPRQATAAGTVGPQLERQTIVPTSSGANIHREEILRDLPGGRDRINDWVSRHAGNADRAAISRDVLADIERDYSHLTGSAIPTTEAADFAAKGDRIADWVSQLEAAKYAGKINEHPFFRHSLVDDTFKRGQQHARTMAGSRAIVAALASAAKPVGGLSPGADHILANEALVKLGLGSFDKGNELVGAPRELYRRLAPKGAGQVEPLVTGPAPYGVHAELGNWAIPRADYHDLAKQYAGWMAPEESKGAIRLLDSVTNSFKALAYPIWLASHVRNAATAGLNNMRTGTSFADYARQLKLMRGGLPPAEADALRKSQYAHANIFGGGGRDLELQGTTAMAGQPTARKVLDYLPGTNGYGMGRVGPTGSLLGDSAYMFGKEGVGDLASGIYKKLTNWKKEPNPFSIAGVGKDAANPEILNTVDRFSPVVVGRKLSGNIEDFFRGAQFNSVVRKGGTPGQAADAINRFHFDYSPEGTTAFEKNIAKRIFPFYRFSRGNLPLQLETIATRPAQFSAPFAPTRVDRDKQEYVPDYLSGGFAMPLGAEENGSRRFLSSLGLPQEEALKELQLWNGRPDLTQTAMRYAGSMNPLFKGPLEQIAGKQFFSGRDLSTLRPSSTATTLAGLVGSEEVAQPLSQFLSNTPATRFMTSADKLLDTQGLAAGGRKPGWATAMNLLTGARISDVDVAKQQYLEQRAALNALLTQSPNVSTYHEPYFRPEAKEKITPLEAEQMRAFYALQKQGKEHMKMVRQREGQLGR